MEKLIKKFESIINLYPGSNVPAPNYPKTTIGERGAIECKKVAIAFAKWSQSYYLFEGTDNWMDDDLYSPIEPKYTSTDLFNKFIKEEYGRE